MKQFLKLILAWLAGRNQSARVNPSKPDITNGVEWEVIPYSFVIDFFVDNYPWSVSVERLDETTEHLPPLSLVVRRVKSVELPYGESYGGT